MKPLQNPWVVGGLVLLALALVFRNALWPLLRRPRAPAAQPRVIVPPTSAPVPPVVAVAPKPHSNLSAEERDDSQKLAQFKLALVTDVAVPMLQTSVVRWAEAPRRDPFQVRVLPKIELEPQQVLTNQVVYPPAMELLTLSAIWRQTGSKLAVINHRLVGEGDTLLKFKIENIEADHIWVSGPNGREQVEFPLSGSR
jgi:hypothetical protein